MRFDIEGVGRATVHEGQVALDLDPGVDPTDPRVAEATHGPLRAAALRQQGLAVLHASAVELNGAAAAILGPSGAGKSTLAALLIGLGARLLADDVVAVEHRPDGLYALPAGRPLRLLPAVAQALGLDGQPSLDKLAIDVAQATSPVRLGALYLVGRRGPLTGVAALAALVEHSWLPALDLEPVAGAHLENLSRIARAVPMKGIGRPRALSSLRKAAAALART